MSVFQVFAFGNRIRDTFLILVSLRERKNVNKKQINCKYLIIIKKRLNYEYAVNFS